MLERRLGTVAPSTVHPAKVEVASSLGNSLQKRRKRVSIALAMMGSATAVFAGVASGKQAATTDKTLANEKVVGIATNEIFVKDQDRANKIAKAMSQAGIKAVRVFGSFIPSSAEINNDPEYCVAAKAAYDNGLDLYIDMVGYYRNGNLGYMPKTPSQKSRFVTKLGNIMWRLAGPNGCVPEEKNIHLGIGNEPDNRTGIFTPDDYTAADLVDLLAYAYPKLHDEAVKPELGVTLDIEAPDIAYNDYAYIQQIGDAIRQKGITGKILDKFTLHPYSTDYSNPLGNIADYPKVLKSIKDALGYTPQVITDEFGINTTIPPSRKSLYSGKSPSTVLNVTEAAQAKYYRDALAMVACQENNQGLFFYRWTDESDLSRTHSAVNYANENWDVPIQPKSSLPNFMTAVSDFNSGVLAKNC